MRSTQNLSAERRSELIGLAIACLTLVLFLALKTDGFDVSEQSTRPLDEMHTVPNLLGAPGALVAGVFALLVGDARHVLYSLTFVWAIMLISHRPVDRLLPRFVGAGILLISVASFLQLNVATGSSNADAGGALGHFVVSLFMSYGFGIAGANIIVCAMVVVGLLLAAEYLFIYLFLVARHGGAHLFDRASVATLRRRGEEKEQSKKERAGRSRRKPQQVDLPLDEAEIPAPIGSDVPEVASEPELEPDEDPLSRITIRGTGAPDVVEEEEEAPFDAVPDVSPVPAHEEVHEEDDVFAEEEEGAFVYDLDAPVSPTPDDVALEEPPFEEAPFDEAESLDVPGLDDYAESMSDDVSALGVDVFDETPEVEPEPVPEPVEEPVAAAPVPEKAKPKPRRARRKAIAHEEIPHDYQYPKTYSKPSLDILDEPEETVVTDLSETLRATSVKLEETLQTFGIEARVTDVTRGPTITRYELEPAPGIKVARFQALADDIALALKAHRIRVEAPIPGKGRVGIEAPNTERDPVLIRELIESRPFRGGKGKLNLVLGKDIAGDVKIADLATMPHLLVAGATGAGKTVCVKALLASLLFKHSPDDLQLILIDPKMVELSIFNDIPHLITPVVIDPKKASISLTWLINEMEERYRLFADLRVRNIEVYNQSVENGEIEMEGDEDEGDQQHLSIIRRLPYIVCVIDELADLMMLARNEVEDSIGRLAQLARAVGIHLIIATQRPSVDVLTGVIKANFPSRISFQVSSRVDSRCILDEIGAERLIGMGDMLYLPAGQSKPTRIQGAFVSDEEMNSLIMHLKRQAPPQYKDEIENWGKSKDKLEEIADEADELFDDAVQVVMETGQASISMVQRRLRVGYTRAARLIDMMERKGIVGPHTGSKAREILVETVQAEESS